MKKALVILLALTMVMSMFAMLPFGASAADELAIGEVAADYKPEGTAIKTAEEFAAMAADGKYYLANDITVSATYANDFVGTFDGNGKKITTTVPLFDQFNGTAMNLTIEGNIVTTEVGESAAGAYIGAFARIAGNNGDASFTNIVNKASLSSSVVGMGGIVGLVGGEAADQVVIFTSCSNIGNITGGAGDTGTDSAGIAARYLSKYEGEEYKLQFINCSNYGTINTTGRPGGISGTVSSSALYQNCYNAGDIQSLANYCAGIASRAGEKFDTNAFKFENCVNDGAIDVFKSQGGGIVGYSSKAAKFEYKNCTNNGLIYCQSVNCMYDHCDGDDHAAMALGGIIGSAQTTTAAYLFEGCVNNGQIGIEDLGGGPPEGTADKAEHAYRVGGMAGQIYTKNSVIFKNCVNNGNIYADMDFVDDSTGKVINMAGGMIARIAHSGKKMGYTYTINFVGCINNGEIHSTWEAGGMVAHHGTSSNHGVSTFDMCGNTGDVTAEALYAGGILGYIYGSDKGGANITRCFNVGNIHSGKNKAAGLVGYTNMAAPCVIEYNYVAGKITSDANSVTEVTAGVEITANNKPLSIKDASGKVHYFMIPVKGTVNWETDGSLTFVATGAASHAVAKATPGTKIKDNQRFTFEYDNKMWASYSKYDYEVASASREFSIIGYDDEGNLKVKVGSVELIAHEFAEDDKTFTNWYTSDTVVGFASALLWNNKQWNDVSKNYIVEGAAPVNAVMGYGNGWVSYTFGQEAKTVAEADLATGKLAKTLNDAIGEDIFRQNLDAELFNVDLYPTTDKSHAKVVEVGGVLTNEVFDTTNDSGSPSTGDATIYVVVALAVSTISLAAVAVVRKNKEN